MSDSNYKVGMIVTHPNKPEWGPGQVVTVTENSVHIFFQDNPKQKTRMFNRISSFGPIGWDAPGFETTGEKMEANVQYFANPKKIYSFNNLEQTQPPSRPGVYGWYFDDPPPCVPTNGCIPVKTGRWPFRTKRWLLYIGKASDLRFRIYEMHFNNKFWMNKSLSSLRLILGCLLCKKKNLYLRKNSDPQKDYTFGQKGDRKLSHWMAKHARVTWAETTEYVELEKQAINRYVLPLNTKDNPEPFVDPLKNLKDKLTNIARSQKPKKKYFRKAYKKFVKECKALRNKK